MSSRDSGYPAYKTDRTYSKLRKFLLTLKLKKIKLSKFTDINRMH